ncbi:MAG: hypothetical protein ACE5HS_13240 [bacterium]
MKKKRFKRKRQKRKVQTKKRTAKNKTQAVFPDQFLEPEIDLPVRNVYDYFWDEIFLEEGDFENVLPNHEIDFHQNIRAFCNKRLGTSAVRILEALYQKATDVLVRVDLARKIYALQKDYLQSFKEYSDRALMLLTEREKLFDKWEGIYILGCFGSKSTIPYLQKRRAHETNQLLKKTMERAIQKIEINAKKKIRERGF